MQPCLPPFVLPVHFSALADGKLQHLQVPVLRGNVDGGIPVARILQHIREGFLTKQEFQRPDFVLVFTSFVYLYLEGYYLCGVL